MKLIKGDILNLCKEGAIIQQVNCQGAYGAGLSGNISKKYPKVYTEYSKFCKEISKSALLGRLQKIKVSDDVEIFNSFTQYSYGNSSKTGIVYTNEKLLYRNIHIFNEYCNREGIKGYCPLYIGADLAGGNKDKLRLELEKTELYVIEYARRA